MESAVIIIVCEIQARSKIIRVLQKCNFFFQCLTLPKDPQSFSTYHDGENRCHFQILLAISESDTADFTYLKTRWLKSAVSLKWQVGFENEMK